MLHILTAHLVGWGNNEHMISTPYYQDPWVHFTYLNFPQIALLALRILIIIELQLLLLMCTSRHVLSIYRDNQCQAKHHCLQKILSSFLTSLFFSLGKLFLSIGANLYNPACLFNPFRASIILQGLLFHPMPFCILGMLDT